MLRVRRTKEHPHADKHLVVLRCGRAASASSDAARTRSRRCWDERRALALSAVELWVTSPLNEISGLAVTHVAALKKVDGEGWTGRRPLGVARAEGLGEFDLAVRSYAARVALHRPILVNPPSRPRSRSRRRTTRRRARRSRRRPLRPSRAASSA